MLLEKSSSEKRRTAAQPIGLPGDQVDTSDAVQLLRCMYVLASDVFEHICLSYKKQAIERGAADEQQEFIDWMSIGAFQTNSKFYPIVCGS